MSRHRNVRNRVYSYEDEEYDEHYDDCEPNSPNSNEFMYRRDSPSRQQSVFSFVSQDEMQVSYHINNEEDAEILQVLVPQVQQVVSSNRFTYDEIIRELRNVNYDLEKAVMALLETQDKTPVVTMNRVLPLQIQIPKLETVARTVENDEIQSKKEIVMPAPTKGKVMAIGGGAMSSPCLKKIDDNEEKKSVRVSVADAINVVSTISRTQTQFTPAEKKAFERIEMKTQDKAVALEEKTRNGGKTKISLVVIGHVDAGKSTITGHLLYKLGYVSKKLMHKYEKESREAGKLSFAYAWVMDADEEERSRGVTMDVGMSYFETATKHLTLLDAPGHRDFIPRMIAGAAQADVAMLVVPAVTGEFEAAFENSGQTKEHTLLVRSFGVSQMVVAVNKMDMVNWDKDRFDNIVKSLSTFLKGAGFQLKNLRFVPVSGITGANLEKTGEIKECSWYSGHSLVEAIDTFAPPQRQISKPFRMTVSDVSKSMSLGQTITGRIYAGAAAVGDSFLLMPIGLSLTIKGMEQDGKTCALARAGDTIEMGVAGIDPLALTCDILAAVIQGFSCRRFQLEYFLRVYELNMHVYSTGSILCSIASPVRLAKKFEAKIMTMPAVEVPLVKGTCVTIHMHNVDEPVNITRLVSILDKTGEVEKKKPRCITRERSAVVQITCHRKICLEEFAHYRQLGRFTLRDRGKTLAAGIVTQIIA